MHTLSFDWNQAIKTGEEDSLLIIQYSYVETKSNCEKQMNKCGWRSDRMNTTKEKESAQEKNFLVSLCPPQILPGLAWDWTQMSNVSGKWLTTLSMVQTRENDNGKTFRE